VKPQKYEQRRSNQCVRLKTSIALSFVILPFRGYLAVSAAFGDGIRYTPIAGQGTRVEAKPIIDKEAFQEVARSAIAASQEKPNKY
jgi:hypothetical protein